MYALLSRVSVFEVDRQVELRLLAMAARVAQPRNDGEDRDPRHDGGKRLVGAESEPHRDREEEVRQLLGLLDGRPEAAIITL